MENPSLLTKAESIIQREAILSELSAAGIESLTSPRDMSRKVSENTVDLGLNGYSVFFDGFPIYVRPEDLERAKSLLATILSGAKAEPSSIESPHFKKFYFCVVFTFMLPVVLHLLAAFHLYKALKNGEKIEPAKFTISMIIYFVLPICLLYYFFQQN